MATNKSNKNKSSMLRSPFSKRPLSKWLVAAGVALVVLVGVLVVRYSSASKWVSIKHTSGKWTLTTNTNVFEGYGNSSGTTVPGRLYRVCLRGYSQGASSVASIALWRVDSVGHIGPVAWTVSNKTYHSTSEFHCSGQYQAPYASTVFPVAAKKSGANITITAVSVDELR